MCFSPAVSFTASAVLTVAGIATLNKVTDKRENPLACIPLLFAAQQFIEGMIWVSLQHSAPVNIEHMLIFIYTFFAGMLWPALIPFSILMLEQNTYRKKALLFISILGTGFALYTLTGMFISDVTVQQEGLHLVYHHPWENNHTLLTYLIITCIPFFLSSNIRIIHLGTLNAAAFFITYYFYNFYLASVWCFFAALISGAIYVFFIHEHRYKTSVAF